MFEPLCPIRAAEPSRGYGGKVARGPDGSSELPHGAENERARP